MVIDGSSYRAKRAPKLAPEPCAGDTLGNTVAPRGWVKARGLDRERGRHPFGAMAGVFSFEPMNLMTPFEDALAAALDRCGGGESAESVAAEFPEHDLLPYLRLVQRIQSAPGPSCGPSSDWMQRSLQRLLTRRREERTGE